MAWVALAVALLAVHNMLGNEVLPEATYVPVNVLTGAVLLVLALAAGASLDDLGLARDTIARGLVVGGVFALVVAAALALGAAIPATRGLFDDRRVAGIDGGELAYEALVRIPIGTAAFEEVAFRGVLLALLLRSSSTVTAVAVSSALFGLWHIFPTLSALRVNDLASSSATRAAAVTGVVVATAIGGVLFCWLRLATGSLLAPVVVHTATNSFAIVTAYAVMGSGR